MEDKLIILDDNHPLVKHIKEYPWGEVLNFGEVYIIVEYGKPKDMKLIVEVKLN